ncbi:MAG: hypothetical protein C4535_14580 [Comamonadaceae bacterium]|nr:MAG: hypothetical protein C4535_14580 [Comamonadaceae bacterium]
MSNEPELLPLQRDVQRAIGRALLRFQHLERVLKGLVAGRFTSAMPGQAEAAAKQRLEQVMNSPLGWLKEELLGKYLNPEGNVADESELDKAAARGHIAFRFNLEVPAQDHASLSQHLSVVHERRNVVVHHFLDTFDLQSRESCSAALAYLEETHQLLDTHQGEVLLFAEWAAKMNQVMARQLQGPEFAALLQAGREELAPPPKKKRRRRARR